MDNFIRTRPDGDTHDREVCHTCGFINYQNPKIIVGSVVRHADRILMCRRAIEPSIGLWTLPAGYMEIGETVAEGAQREAREEACATIAIDGVLAVYSLAHIAQVQIIHLATLIGHNFAPGPESMEVRLFAWDELPWNTLAFPSVAWALKHERMAQYGAHATPFTAPA
ncbi:MAG: NUDIX hydrolase [Pseudomonadota bacterium]